MAIGPLELSTLTRSQDYTVIKHNEDNKNFVDQTNFGQQLDKNVEQMAHQVQNSDNAEWHKKKEDAKDKGSNAYMGDGGKNRKRKVSKEQVVVKGRQGFDMKI